MPKVKKSLEDAIAVIDEYLGAEGLGIVRDLRSILKNKNEDSRARVAAGSKLLDYIKPPKGTQISVNANTQINSSLNLPPAPVELSGPKNADRMIDAKDVQKILPEPARQIGRGFGAAPFSADAVQGPKEPARLVAPTLPERSQLPKEPAQPPSAITVRPFEPPK